MSGEFDLARSLFGRLQEWGDGVKLDASDRDGDGDDSDEEGKINLQNWPTVKGMYLPDSVNTFKAKADGRRCEF